MSKFDLSLTEDEIDRFLGEQRTIRLATADRDGDPHVVPLWFVWVDGLIFMNSTLGNLTLRNLETNPRATGSVDDGDSYGELRGVLIHGRVELVGVTESLGSVEAEWSMKYMGGEPVPYANWKDRVWLVLSPDRFTSWDFRKIPGARARAGA